MVFCWRADDGPPFNAGLVGSFVVFQGMGPELLRNPIFLWFFRVGAGPLSPPLDPRMGQFVCISVMQFVSISVSRTFSLARRVDTFLWIQQCQWVSKPARVDCSVGRSVRHKVAGLKSKWITILSLLINWLYFSADLNCISVSSM